VLLQENTERSGDRIRFTHRPYAGEHVRARGSDLKAGAVALPSGMRVNAFSLSLCTSLERRELMVSARPRVSLLCTGDELRAPGSVNFETGSIVESNSVALVSLLQKAGADVQLGAYVPDSLDATEQALRAALQISDLVITVGGASVGDHDYVKPALSNLGAKVDFWKVKLKPGKPLLVAHFDAIPAHLTEADGATKTSKDAEPRRVLVLGLPGNPVSAQLTCLLFALPLVRKLQGQSVTDAPFRQVPLLAKLTHKPGRAGLFRARWQANGVLPLPESSSGSVLSMSQADAIILARADQAEFPAGSLVPVMSLYEAVYL
jgi:molybdopterin molybdotransferase